MQLLQEADRAEGGAEDGAAAQGARQRLPPPMLSVRGTNISTLPTFSLCFIKLEMGHELRNLRITHISIPQ